MKKKIEEALRTEYAGLGLSDKTIGRLADYVKGSVENEEDIALAVKKEDVALIAKSIQGEIDGIQKAKRKAEEDLAEYKAKHPETQEPVEEEKEEPKLDWKATLAAALKEQLAPLQEEIATLKSQSSTKAALEGARETFFGNNYAKKYKDEADDAWDRAVELNEATGNKMTAEQLSEKASTYFNKAVARRGVDTSKPFVADPSESEQKGTMDWSAEKKRQQAAGRIPKEQNV